MYLDIDLEEMDEKQRKLAKTSVFLGKLLLAGLLFRAVLFLDPDSIFLQSRLADLISGILNLTGFNSSTEGIFVFSGSDIYEITRDCLGWKSMSAFAGLMFASASLRENYRFLILGLFAIAVANIIRIITTIYLGHFDILSFSIIHGTLWRWGLTAVVLLLWTYWLARKDMQTFYTSISKRLI